MTILAGAYGFSPSHGSLLTPLQPSVVLKIIFYSNSLSCLSSLVEGKFQKVRDLVYFAHLWISQPLEWYPEHSRHSNVWCTDASIQ